MLLKAQNLGPVVAWFIKRFTNLLLSDANTVTRNELHGPGSNPGDVEIFRTRPDRPWGPLSLNPGVKRLGRVVDHPFTT
jgi:hypothetical protein